MKLVTYIIFWILLISSCCRGIDCAVPFLKLNYINSDSVRLLDKPGQPFYIENLEIISLDKNQENLNLNYSERDGILRMILSRGVEKVIIKSANESDTIVVSKYYTAGSGCCDGQTIDAELTYKGKKQCGPCDGTTITIMK